MKDRLIFALSILCVFGFLLPTLGAKRTTQPMPASLYSAQNEQQVQPQENAPPSPQTFQCGDTTLEQSIETSGDEAIQGSYYVATVKTKNVGTGTVHLATNFLFIDPNSKIVDGDTGHNPYWLEPGSFHVMSWKHAFGCSNRPKGEYYLNVGTQIYGTTDACQYFYREVELLNKTICKGHQP